MSAQTLNEQFLNFKKAYKNKPISFFENVLKMKLTFQQKKIVVKAIKLSARVAVRSGTGTGKTTICAGIILHQLLVTNSIKIMATAPSAGQLKRGLKSEVKKLHRRMPEWAQSLLIIQNDQVVVKGIPDNFCSFVSADTDNQESLAGVHAGKVIVINDEASALTDSAYDTLKGNLTTEGSSMIQISNPVRSDGKFRNLWRNKGTKSLWQLFTLSGLDSPLVSKKYIQEVADEYGVDSDMYRMRVLGFFPKVSESMFFNSDSIESAMGRIIPANNYHLMKKIMGVDVARFGNDNTVFVIRQGPMILDAVTYHGKNTVEVAMLAAEFYHKHGASIICVDGCGVGAGVVDNLQTLDLPVADIVSNVAATDPRTYVNMRAQLYGETKVWLENDASIPDTQEVYDQFSCIRYGLTNKMQVQMTSKADLIKRFKSVSPDIVDAIIYTFYEAWANFNTPHKHIHSQKRKVVSSGFVFA